MQLHQIYEELLVGAGRKTGATVVLGPDSPGPWAHRRLENAKSQFLFLLKPELTSAERGVDVRRTLTLVEQTALEWGVEVLAFRVWAGPELKATDLIGRHWQTLARLSRQGLAACSPMTAQRLAAFLDKHGAAGSRVLGGHQVVAQCPALDPAGLQRLVDGDLPRAKIGSGAYVSLVTLPEGQTAVLNGFYPFHEEHFTHRSVELVAMGCVAPHDFAELRRGFLGATDPAAAAPTSLKGRLRAQQSALGIAEVSVMLNGFHMSPGPVEGLHGLLGFLGPVSLEETMLGDRLAALGVPADDIRGWLEDPLVREPDLGTEISLFELTEDRSTEDTLQILKELRHTP